MQKSQEPTRKKMKSEVTDFGTDLWVELVIANDMCDRDILNLSLTSKFFLAIMQDERIKKFMANRTHFGTFKIQPKNTQTSVPVHMASIAWSSDGNILAAADSEGWVFLWDAKTGKLIKQFDAASPPSYSKTKADQINFIQFHPRNNNIIGTAHEQGRFHLWDVQTLEKKLKSEEDTAIRCFAFHPEDDDVLVHSGYPALRFLKISTQKNYMTYADRIDLDIVKFSHAAKHVITTCTSDLDIENFVRVWDFDLTATAYKISDDRKISAAEHVGRFVLTADDKTLITASQLNESVSFFDFETGQTHTKFQPFKTKHPSTWIELHPNQKTLVLGGKHGLEIWDIDKNLFISHIDSPDVLQFAFSPDGTALAVVTANPDQNSAVQVLNFKKYW